MNFEEAFKVADVAVCEKTGEHLKHIDRIVFEGAWQERAYIDIAENNGYGHDTIKGAGKALWDKLSEALGEKVSKKNFKTALEFRGRSLTATPTLHLNPDSQPPAVAEPKMQFSQVDLESTLYVERPPIESMCYKTLLQPGSLIRIKAPQQMGKTLLMTRVLAQLATRDYRTVHLSLQETDRVHLTNLDRFLQWLCRSVSRELELQRQLDDYWYEEDGSKVNCTAYFEEYLLAEKDTPLVLCLDNVDLVFPYPEIYEDFFGLLRSWYEKAQSRPTWRKLRLVVVHSTEDYLRLNIHQSPFNVGIPIELSEFTREQVQDFAQQHGLDWSSDQVDQLMTMVGGHPYLVQQAVSHLKAGKDITLEQLLEMAPTEAGIYRNHLRENLLSLEQYPELAEALKKVVTATSSVRLESTRAYKLHSMGLVELEGNNVKPRCNLYRKYFCERLVNI